MTEIEKTGSLYQAGIDKFGRPVIVFIGKWFKPDTVSLEQALLYLIKVLDPVADKDYSVVYFCTRTTNENMISYWYTVVVRKPPESCSSALPSTCSPRVGP